MAHHAKLVVAAIIAAFSHAKAFAGYANVAPPAGWGGSAAGGWTFNVAKAANGERWVNGSVMSRVTTNVGGRMVTMPAQMRMAANAGQFVLRRIAGMHPAGRAALVIVPAVAAWLADSGIRWNSDTDQWEYKAPGTSGDPVLMWYITPTATYTTDPDVWCKTMVPGGQVGPFTYQPAHVVSVNSGLLTCGQYYGDNNGNTYLNPSVGGRQGVYMCPGTPPKPPDANGRCEAMPEEWKPGEFEPQILPRIKPLPDAVPNTAPETAPELAPPVELPSINPDPNGNPQRKRYPSGDPIPVPGADPAQWRQPYIDVVPRPTWPYPWQVDMQPGELTQDNPTPNDPSDVPEDDPSGTPRPSTPAEEQKQLCDVYPDVVACQTLGETGPVPLEEETVEVKIEPKDGFGGGGSCPAPRTANIAGKSYSFEWTAICDFATGIKPIVVAVAWLTAILSFMGLSRRD